MGEDLSTAYKIAAGACIMAFILSIGLSLMMIGRNFWNKTADQVTNLYAGYGRILSSLL